MDTVLQNGATVSGMDASLASEIIEQLTEGAPSDDTILARVQELVNMPGAVELLGKLWPTDRLPVVGAYFCLTLLGRGASGVVYKALRLEQRPRLLALKLLRFVGEEEKQRFVEREIEILRALRCPHVARYLDSGSVGGTHYLAMELVRGLPLDEYLARHTTTLDEKLAVFQKTCEVVAGVHAQGVIHRDLKPRHILVDEEGQPHLVDFGLSAARSDDWATAIRETRTQLGRIMGTLRYMPPEQAWGGLRRTDHRADIWSLGVMLYEIATEGGYPYDLGPMEGMSAADALLHRIRTESPKRPRVRAPELAGALTTLISRCLVHEPKRRLQSAGELAADIARCRTKKTITTRPLPLPYRLQRIAIGLAVRSRAALWSAIILGVVSSLLVVSVVFNVRSVVIADGYSGETIKRLLKAAHPTGAIEFTIVAVSDDTMRALPGLADRAGLTGVTEDLRTWRAVHGRLMERLAGALPRLVVWDYYFKTRRAGDAAFVKGAKALDAVGVPVVLATTGHDNRGVPMLSPDIYGPLEGVAHHGLVLARDMVKRPGEFVIALRRGQRTYASLALAAFGALCYPDRRMEVFWSDRTEDLKLRYRTRGARAYLSSLDEVGVSSNFVMLGDAVDARKGDILACKAFELLPPESWRQRTVPYERLITASAEELASLVANRVVVVIDTRRPQLWDSRDWHPVRFSTGKVELVPGGYLLANAIKGMTGDRYYQPMFPPKARFVLPTSAMAVVGCLLAVLVGRREALNTTAAATATLAAFAAAAVLAIVALVVARTGTSVELAAGVAATALAAVGALPVEFARNRYRVPSLPEA